MAALPEPVESGNDLVVVDVRGVDKRFTLRHTRSIKEYLVWTLRGRTGELSETFLALNDLSFQVHQGESIGLLGFNGSGKSTTLKMLSGVMRPDHGEVLIRGRIAGLIEVGAGFHPDLTGRENIYLNGAILGMSEAEIDARFDDIVAFSEIERFIDTEVKFYSSGMFLRLAFAVAVHSEPDIFLVDEILAVGDEPFQRKCIRRIRELKAQGQTLMVVSHDLNMIQRICDRGIVLDHGVVTFDGPIGSAVKYLRETRPKPATSAPGQTTSEAPKKGFWARLRRGRSTPAALPPPQEAAPSHLTPLFTELNLQPWRSLRPIELLPERSIELNLHDVDEAVVRYADRPLDAPFATIAATDMAEGARIGFTVAGASVALTCGDEALRLSVIDGSSITTVGHIPRRPDRLALCLTGPTISVWDTGPATPEPLLVTSWPESFAEPHAAAARGDLVCSWSGRMATLRAGRFGWLGVRDPHLVLDGVGEPCLRDGRALLTLTCAGPDGFASAHWGMFSLDPDDPGDLRHEADLWFERDQHRYGDHAGQLLVRDGRVEVLVSAWGGFDRSQPNVHIRRGELPALPSGSVVVPSEPVALPTEFPCWDPDLRWSEGQWNLAFVECFGHDERLEFRPVLAVADGDDGGPTSEWLRVGSDLVHHQTEGTLFYTDADEVTWLIASDGDARDYPVYDLGMVRRGTLVAPYGTGIPHACILRRADRPALMISFDETPADGGLPYGSHGDLLIHRAP